MLRIIARGVEGFTIVEAGIALGIASIAAAGISASLIHVQKSARSVSMGAEVMTTQSQLQLAFGTESACTEILRNLPYPSEQEAMKFSIAFPAAG